MKRIPTLPALKRFIALSIFVLAAVTASAQVYYLNVYGKGERTRYLISDLDSVSLSVDKAPIQGLEYVDLGLSSGLKWASMNLGATTPYEPGNYYAWGETEPKETYSYSTYKFKYVTAAQTSGVSKYNFNSVNGPVDYKYRLDMEDDAARVNWGEDWRMPTVEELSELMSECRWEWKADTSKNGFKGYKITGPNNNFIYLPVAQYRYDEGTNNYNEEYFVASYLTSTLYPEDCLQAMGMDLMCEYYKGVWYSDFEISPQGRSFGELIRPVYSWKAPENVSPITHFDVAEKTIKLSVGESYSVKYQMDSTVFVSPALTMTQSSGLRFIDNEVIVALLPGTYNVKANLGEFTVELTVIVAEPEIVAQAVDLGLSVKWATNNLGAETPSQFGYYYSWGETDPKSAFNNLNYKWYDNTSGKYSKYVTDTVYGKIDGKYVLDIEDDAARQTWGGNWRMPTQDEFDELFRNCAWEWTTDNGVNGYKLTAKNGNSIFLPAAGYDGVSEQGYLGAYWTSSLGSVNTNAQLYYIDDSYAGMTPAGRVWGFSIRPVEAYGAADADTLMLDVTKLQLAPGAIYQIGIHGLTVDGKVISIDGVEWASSDKSVATVENGVITAVAEGSAIITATVNNKVLECAVTVMDASKPQIVDLGLSVKWASFDIGSTSPFELGNYYAWGAIDTTTYYNYESYRFFAGYDEDNNPLMSKYVNTPNFGTVDNLTVLEAQDDVASVLLGGNWRIPSCDEFYELFSNCDRELVESDGLYAIKLTSCVQGYTDNFIVIPLGKSESVNTYYWTNEVYIGNALGAFAARINKNGEENGLYYRFEGMSVRPVYTYDLTEIDGISVDKDSVALALGAESVVKVNYFGANGRIIKVNAAVDLSWTSDDSNVATVDNGKIKAIGAGSCIVTLSYGDKTCKIYVTVQDPTQVTPESVDLGLSVKWAAFNLGAFSPEMFGDYYAWGEKEPYYEAGYAESTTPVWKDGKEKGYSWESYFDTDDDGESFIKYSKESGKTVLDLDDDPAYLTWGEFWRIPTEADFQELIDSCSWEYTELSGVQGVKITSNVSGFENNSIFIPFANYRSNTGIENEGSGYYWTSSIDVTTSYVRVLFLNNIELYDDYKYYGQSYRPVELFDDSNIQGITLGASTQELSIGNELSLIASGVIDGRSIKLSGAAEWTSSDESVVTVSNGVVKSIGVGTATITASYNGLSGTCEVTVIDPYDVDAEYVNLGLSVNWATFNLGADAPEEKGEYFAWGETLPKSDYSWNTYKYGTREALTKYCTDRGYSATGDIDGKTVLDAEDDAAYVLWGGDWRMPTQAECQELIDNCTWAYTTFKGVTGYLVTSNVPGYTDKYIFLPITGYKSGSDEYTDKGYYWTSSLVEDDAPTAANYLYVSEDQYSVWYHYRYQGRTIRPVCTNPDYVPSANPVVLTDNVTILVNDYVEGERQELAAPRIVADPADATNQCIVVTTNANYNNNYDAQLMVVINESLLVGQRIELSMRVKADQWQRSGVESHTTPGQYVATNPFNAPYFDTDWDKCNWTINVTDPSITTYVFDLSYLTEGNNCYFDDISVRIIDTWEGELLLSKDELTISVGSGSVSLAAYDNSGTGYNNFTQWSSSDETVATVDKYGNITAVSEGTAVITAEFRGVTATCTVTVAPYEPVLEYVNLGLSVNWATCNIGASDQTGSGFYFAWAETDQKSDYSWSTYSYNENGDGYSFTKYYYDPKSPDTNTDNLRVIQPGDDVAAQLMGGNWRMPSAYEFEELISNCNWETVSMDNVYGYLITSRVEGYTDNYIFLPLSGLKSGTSLYMQRDNGYYWTSSLSVKGDASLARNLVMGRWGDLEVGQDDRYLGMSVRPVIPNEDYVDKIMLTDNVSLLVDEYREGETVNQVAPREIADPSNSNNHCIVVSTNSNPQDVSDAKLYFTINEELQVGEQIELSMRIKADKSQNSSVDGDAFNAPYFGTEWERFNVYFSVYDPSVKTYSLSLAYLDEGNNLYFDDIDVKTYDYYGGGLYIDGGDDDVTVDIGSYVPVTLYDQYDNDWSKYAVWTSSDENVATIGTVGAGRMLAIKGVGAGTATITAQFREETASITVAVKRYEPVEDYVDLGLSVNWATCNLGAYVPSANGFYYAWGETETKTDYTWSTYSYYAEDEGVAKFNKYTLSDDESVSGTADNLRVLEATDDVVAQLMGGNWRMPTSSEIAELVDKCDWEMAYSEDGIAGFKITSKVEGYTDKSIFLPLNGYYNESYNNRNGGYYWSSSLGSNNGVTYARMLNVDYYGNVGYVLEDYRYKGMGIRPVFPNENYVDKIVLTDNITLLANDYPGGERQEMVTPRTVTDPENPANQCLVVTTNSNPDNNYDAQLFITINEDLIPGEKIHLSMRVKADQYQSFGSESQTAPGEYYKSNPFSRLYFYEEWQMIDQTITVTNADVKTYAFNLSYLSEANNCYFDDISIEVIDNYAGGLSMSQSELTMDYGASAAYLSVIDSEGNTYTNYAQWTSSDESVVTVMSGSVEAVGIGTATITATYRGEDVTCSVTVKEYEPVYDVVDLGLSVNWATCNVGASSPEGIGFYYAWGEKETKTDYSLDTYYYYSNEDPYGYKKYTLYNYDSYTGTSDDKTVLEAADDVAALLFGGNFRMATSVEFQELVSECQWQSETVNGVSGYRITSTIDGYTDKSIFIPANGYKSGTGTYSSSYGYYWTSSLSSNSDIANNLVISKSGWYSSTSSRITNNSREYGMGIRPVVPSETWQGITSIAISETSISMTEYDNASLSAVLMSGDADYSFMADGLVWTSSDEDVVTVDEYGQLLAIAAGEATITVTYNNISATCPVTVSAFSYEADGTLNNHEYVDLGLSVNWATFNIGSTSLTGLGDYFAWGEVEPYYAEGYAQSNDAVWKSGKELGYVSESNRYYAYEGFETQQGWTKYCSDPQCGKDEFTDDLTELVSSDDAASAIWGATWRTPGYEEFTELQNNCEWTWMIINGVEGFKIVSNVKGYEGKFIFLPCTGIRSYEEYYDGGGQYWSKSLYSEYPESAYALAFYSGYGYMTSFGRSEGMAVRAVCPKE